MSMTSLLDRTLRFVFADPVRPLEVLYVIALLGWAFILITNPSVLALDQYSALGVLPAPAWAAIQIVVAMAQIATFFIDPDRAVSARYFSMTMAAGLWTLIAVGFWGSPVTTFGAIIYPGLAVLAALSGIWLGWARQHLRT